MLELPGLACLLTSPWTLGTFSGRIFVGPNLKLVILGNSLAIQWLGLHASPAGVMGSIPGPGSKIPHASNNKQNSIPTTIRSYCIAEAWMKLSLGTKEVGVPGVQGREESGRRGHFPGGPVANTPSSQCRGPGSIPGQGTRPHIQQLKIPHAKIQIEDPMCGN